MVAALRRGTANEQCRRLQFLRQGPERRALNTHDGVAAEMRHKISAHERRREGLQREPRRLDGARGENDGAIRRNRQRPRHAVHHHLQRRDD